jgi:molybdate transport system substrate-binding protein
VRYLLLLLAFVTDLAQAQETLTIAASAGYKKPLLELYRIFSEETGIEVTPVFGNMLSVISQSENSGRIALCVGDRRFLRASARFERFMALGRGRPVLAWAKEMPADPWAALLDDSTERIAMPDPKKAIYGRAADTFLQKSGLKERLQDRLLVTGTVPQVSSYLVARSVDAGFINLTDAMALGESIGGYTELPESSYEPIEISAAVVDGHNSDPAVMNLLDFLRTPVARQILRDAGL